MSLAGIPAYFTGMLMPVRQAGSLLPQLMAGTAIRRFAVRKWFWSGAAVVQAMMVAAILGLCLNASDAATVGGTFVIVALSCFSVASRVASISFKEVLAKTIPRGRRGRLLAARTSLGGALALGTGVLIQAFFLSDTRVGTTGATSFGWLLGPAALLWLAAAACFAWIPEPASPAAGPERNRTDVLEGLYLLREKDFLSFLATRGLLLAVPLAMPFFAVLATGAKGADAEGARSSIAGETVLFQSGALMIAMAGSEILSSTFWGRLADRSSRLAMSAGGFLFSLCCLTPFVERGPIARYLNEIPVWSEFVSASGGSNLFYTIVFFILGISYAGVRLGRKTYIVDAAPEKYRSLFVALGNSVIGALTLVWGAGSVFLEVFAPGWIIPALGGLGLCGALLGFLWLPHPGQFCRHLK
ncbi:MAG: hypothetical protein RIF32_03515 [Leptospirales bacterium]|jgi:MFS family permease